MSSFRTPSDNALTQSENNTNWSWSRFLKSRRSSWKDFASLKKVKFCHVCVETSQHMTMLPCEHVICSDCNIEPEIMICCPVCRKTTRPSLSLSSQLMPIQEFE